MGEVDTAYLGLLAEAYPTREAASAEVIALQASLGLPKGTEHFVSDLHGEYGSFKHLITTCSGVLRERVARIFADDLTQTEQDDLCALIYYPAEKLRRLGAEGPIEDGWWRKSLADLVRLARHLANGYPRPVLRAALPAEQAPVIDELLHAYTGEHEVRAAYHARIIDAIVADGSAADYVEVLCALVKRLAVERLHVVGDVFDRGSGADRIIDRLSEYHRVDLQWGNHDLVWMGAAAGSEVCVASVVRTNVHYGTYGCLEAAYGVSLRELALFAQDAYRADDGLDPMEKAANVILFKLMGQLAARRPQFGMERQSLLDAIDVERGTIDLDGRTYELRTRDFPTLDPADPFALTAQERAIVDDLVRSFTTGQRLRDHIGFLYEHGSMYLALNQILLFHGCVPLMPDGSYTQLALDGEARGGKALMDWCDAVARRAWRHRDPLSLDLMFYLACGRYSPACGRDLKTFCRAYIADRSTWDEPRDPYYDLIDDPAVCGRILADFGLDPEHGHIVNGHMPVIARAGERPVRADGKLIVIDGGFCRAYHKRTGTAGYTLIADADGLRIKAHRAFPSIADVLDLGADVMSDSDRFERAPRPLLVADTDAGEAIRRRIEHLRALEAAYDGGIV